MQAALVAMIRFYKRFAAELSLSAHLFVLRNRGYHLARRPPRKLADDAADLPLSPV
jgi:hypothetical protein